MLRSDAVELSITSPVDFCVLRRSRLRRPLSGRALIGLALLTGGLAVTSAGCATVNPRPDFQRTARIIAQHTGIDDTYDPQAEALVEAKVSALVADGLTTNEAV